MKNTQVPPNKILQMLEMYNANVGTESIAVQLDLHPSTVQKYLRQQGVLRSKQKYHHNRNFFDTYTDQSSYWAGMMMSDGYVRSNRHMFGIHLQECDKPHLEEFLAALESSHSLIHDKHTNAYCVQIYSKECKTSLAQFFNVIPNKSKVASYPSQLPLDMHNHFIRGIMDGDGSITFTTVPTLSFVGTVDMLEDMRDIILHNVKYNMRSSCKSKPDICIGDPKKKWFGSLSYYGNTAASVLQWIYKDSTPQTRLYRKYETYKRLFGINEE